MAEFTWTSRSHRRPCNAFPDGIDDFHRTDLRLIWASPKRTWSLEAFVQNVEGEAIYGRIIDGPEFTAGMPVGITPYQPRTYGLRLGYAFGVEAE